MLTNAALRPSQLDVRNNQLCGLDFLGGGTYNAEGIHAIADALRVNASLTKMDLEYNGLGDAGKDALQNAVKGRSGFKLEL